jgi:hypothetical protein
MKLLLIAALAALWGMAMARIQSQPEVVAATAYDAGMGAYRADFHAPHHLDFSGLQ